MIRLQKLAEPASLQNNKEKWTQELLDAIHGGDPDVIRSRKRKYNQPDVKDQLKLETKKKCAYCESLVTVVSHGDIEHITPKSIQPELTFEWENLTLACEVCNGKKSNKEGILDPYADTISAHIFYVGPFVRSRTEKGELTEKELGLNRTELIEDRTEHLGVLADAIEAIEKEPNQRLKQLSVDALLDDLATAKPEYICMKNAVLEKFEI